MLVKCLLPYPHFFHHVAVGTFMSVNFLTLLNILFISMLPSC